MVRVYSLTELLNMTRIELCGLAKETEAQLCALAVGSADRASAVLNIENIKRELARRDLAP